MVAESGVVKDWGDPNQKVAGPIGHAPLRRPDSVRRTMALEASWPDGETGLGRIDGRARDIYTAPFAAGAMPGTPTILDQAEIHTVIGRNRDIVNLESDPAPTGINNLIGCRGGGHLRIAIQDHLPDERALGTPLYLLLDDLAGTTLVAPFAWSRWNPDWMNSDNPKPADDVAVAVQVARPTEQEMADRRARMENICVGFAAGSSAFSERQSAHRVHPVVSLVNPLDPDGWHTLPELPPKSFRRARRIDVWLDPDDSDVIRVDAMFQDSAGDPDVWRVAIHEYGYTATASRATGLLTSIDADPRVLPFLECPSAKENLQWLVGTPVADLRQTVLDKLRSTNGCTHLNDACRALAEVPVLAAHLTER